jgi:MFS family permease
VVPDSIAAKSSIPTAWYQEITPGAWRALTAAGLGWLFEVYDLFVLALTLPALVVVFSLTTRQAGAIGSILAAGLIFGGIFFGWLADRIGRVRVLFLSVLIYSVFTGLTVFAPTASWIMAMRFLAGLGMGGEWTAGAALVAETWPSAHRGKGGALMQIGLPIGSILAIIVVTAITSASGELEHGAWRIVYALGALPIVLLVIFGRNTPESPLWLAQRANATTADKATATAAPNLRGLLVAFGFIFCAQYLYWGVFIWTPSYLVSIKHFHFIHSLLFVFSQQIGSLCGFICFAGLVDRVGRRPSFMLYLVIGVIGIALLTMFSGRLELLSATFLSGFGITGLFAGMGPFAAELVPSSRGRGLAMGIAYNGGRLGGVLAPYIVGALATTAAGFTTGMLTTLVAFVLAFIVVAVAPETKGVELS